MVLNHDTYHRQVLLGASRRRLEDAEALASSNRWIGAIYLGGYAIECALAAAICYNENTNDFRDTQAWKSGVAGSAIHNLTKLLEGSGTGIQNAIQLDRTGNLRNAWIQITSAWQKDRLRYNQRVGVQSDTLTFLSNVRVLHGFLLRQQGE